MHDTAEPQQTLVAQFVEWNFPGVLLPEASKILISHSKSVILSFLALVTCLEPALIQPLLDGFLAPPQILGEFLFTVSVLDTHADSSILSENA